MPVPKGQRVGGRQKGTPNRFPSPARERIEREIDPVGVYVKAFATGKLVIGNNEFDLTPELAAGLLRDCLKKVAPDVKPVDGGKPAPFPLPSIETAGGCGAAMATVLEWAASGAITLEQATAYAGLIETRRKMLESSEFEAEMRAKLAAVEAMLQEAGNVAGGSSPRS
jgi:hypothetical protein